MKATILGAVLLIIIFGAIGCTPPVPCSEGDDTISELVSGLIDCTQVDMVCNEAVSFSDACDAFMDQVAAMVALFGGDMNDYVPDMCTMLSENDPFNLFDLIGSCQALGEEGDPCAEGADCESTVCTGGLCSAAS